MAKKFKINASDGSIKRYSDVVPQEKRRYWYFTTHGIGPGMLPSDVKILETKEGQNKKGTWGDFICLDSVLNTDELKAYDLIELAPDMVESACGSKKAVKSATRKPLRKQAVKASAKESDSKKFRIDIYDKNNPDGLKSREYKSFATKEEAQKYGESIAKGNTVNVMEVKASAKESVKSSTKRRAVKASSVDLDRPNSAPNSWKSSQRDAFKVTDENTKGEKSFPTDIDAVYKALGEMQGAWTNPTTGWTGDCEIFERDLDDGSYIFSLVFGGNESEPDDILYVPKKNKFTIYPHSGAPTFADSLEDFKRKLKKEYSYLKKVSDDVGASMQKQPAKKLVKASSDSSDRMEVINNAKRTAKRDGYNQDVYVDSNGEYGFVRHYDGNIPDWQDAQVIGQVKISWRGTIPSIEYVEMSSKTKTVKASAIAKYKAAQAVKAGINAPSTDGPLCVCENCKAEIESREGRQTVYNVISDLDIEPDERLICDWCEDEATELYQISPDDVEGAKKAVKCSYDDVWEYQESYENNYDDEIPADELDKLNRLGDLTEKYELMWFEKWEELHPNERYSSIDSYPDVDEAVGFTLDEAQYSPEKIHASTKAIKANDGIAPDDYDSVDDMVSDDTMAYDIAPDVAVAEIEGVENYLNGFELHLRVSYVEYNTPDDWVVDYNMYDDEVKGAFIDFVWFWDEDLYKEVFYNPNGADYDDILDAQDLQGQFYPNNNQLKLPHVSIDGKQLSGFGFTSEKYMEIYDKLSDLINKFNDFNEERFTAAQNQMGEFLEVKLPLMYPTLLGDSVEASTDVNADLQLNKNASDRKKYNWGKNPITDLDGYVKDIADGVVERFPNLTYEISDEAITFTNNDSGEVVYIQSIDEIVPEKEDLENDTEELSNAIQHEQEEADWYNQNSDAVEMSTYDDELEPIMGDGFNEDMGFGFDSNGEALTESTVDELRRIANEILQKSELAKIDPYTSIDEDTFKYYASSPHVEEEFYIYFNLTLSGQELYDMDVLEFDDDRTLGWSINKDYEFECDIVVKNGEVKSIIWVDVPEEHLFEATADYSVLDDYVIKLASPVAMDIYNGTTNI